jgi:hypothetical protein
MSRFFLLSVLGLVLIASGIAPVARARDSLGVFDSWGVFRDPATPRCYAIAEPAEPRQDGRWRAFAAIGYWPKDSVRGQVHFRLSREKATSARVTATIGGQRFTLLGGGADAWSADKRADAAIVAAIRSGSSLSVETRSRAGTAFTDVYKLRGAATAIDAAALACAK